jgi:hypothetical protein
MMEYFTIFRNFYQTKTIFMNRLTFALLAAVFSCSMLPVIAQNDQDMKAMMAYSTPGEIHKMLAQSAGDWKATVTMWTQPGASPMVSTAEARNEMILGGRYLQGRNTGNFMGMPFEGISVTGYDNAKKQFVNSWIDNMGTGMMYMTGTWDAATRSIHFSGSMVDPMSGKDIPVREVWKLVDDSTQVLEMYSSVDGKDFKNMEIKYTRK